MEEHVQGIDGVGVSKVQSEKQSGINAKLKCEKSG